MIDPLHSPKAPDQDNDNKSIKNITPSFVELILQSALLHRLCKILLVTEHHKVQDSLLLTDLLKHRVTQYHFLVCNRILFVNIILTTDTSLYTY